MKCGKKHVFSPTNRKWGTNERGDGRRNLARSGEGATGESANASVRDDEFASVYRHEI